MLPEFLKLSPQAVFVELEGLSGLFKHDIGDAIVVHDTLKELVGCAFVAQYCGFTSFKFQDGTVHNINSNL